MPKSQDWKSLYPFRSHELRLDGLRYRYLDEGPTSGDGHGEPLLLVHGNPTWSFYWRNVVLGLRGQHRVIAVDHIGCGLSDKPAEYQYHLSQHIANLRELITRLDLRQITLVVHDWGGPIGLGAAFAEFDRIARVVLLNTAAFRSSRMPWRIRACRTPVLGPLAVRGLNAFCRAALWMAVEHHDRMTPQVRAGLLAPYDSWAHRIAIQRFVDDIPTGMAHPSYATLAAIESNLRRLQWLPVQMVWGMRDWCFSPYFLERWLDFLPRAEVHRLEDAGHYVVEDAPDRVIRLIEAFLEKHPLKLADVGQSHG